jgi:hypothetical protein
MTTMEVHQIRPVPVVDDDERCVGIVAQADLAVGPGSSSTWRCWCGKCRATPSRRVERGRSGVNGTVGWWWSRCRNHHTARNVVHRTTIV